MVAPKTRGLKNRQYKKPVDSAFYPWAAFLFYFFFVYKEEEIKEGARQKSESWKKQGNPWKKQGNPWKKQGNPWV